MEKPNQTELALTDRVYAGYLTDIPPVRSNDVRIYISSTFSDTQPERIWIMKTAVPHLRTFCQERGLDFQIVDLRWGMTHMITDDHSTAELCLKEIRNCQKVSIGPNFVAILGDKYGYRPLVPEIEASEFKLLKNAALELGHDITLLTTWYLCDYNREPTMYVLQPISSLFPSFFDSTPMNDLQHQLAQREWWSVVEKLHHMFRHVTDNLYRNKKISKQTKLKYFQSVIEEEVCTGILQLRKATTKSLCFQRTLNGINPEDGLRIAARFTDLIEKGLDLEIEKLREQLRLEKIRSSIPKDNLFRYNLQWDKHGLDVSGNTQHKSYLDRFGKDFLSSTKGTILSAIEELSGFYGSSPLLEEVLFHLHQCMTHCRIFCGREKVLLEMRAKLSLMEGNQDVGHKFSEKEVYGVSNDFDSSFSDGTMNDTSKGLQNGIDEHSYKTGSHEVKNDSLSNMNKIVGNDGDDSDCLNISQKLRLIDDVQTFSTPLVIYGASGIGKTAVSAKVMELSKTWFPDCVSIIRFLGTTTMSSSIRETIISLCLQISHIYKVPRPVGLDISADFQLLVNYLKTLLWILDTKSRPLLVILDSVDELSTTDHAHSFNWLPVKLPINVHLVVSVVSDRLDCLKNLRIIFARPDRYVEISRLERSEALDIITAIGRQTGRHLARKQSNILLSMFENCGHSLYLKMIADMGLRWRSFTHVDTKDLGANVTSVANQLFDKLETDHCAVLVRHGLGYLCSAKDGLTDGEIEDLLSLDNEVLQETYMHHLPPDPEVIRVPTLLWKRIQNDISEYLTEKKSGNRRVFKWSHKVIEEIATSRYLTMDHQKQFHQVMVEYYQGVWSSKPKPLNLSKGKGGFFPNAYRQVPPQLLTYGDGVYNTRKLNCLPYHLAHCEKFETLLADQFINPEWLYAKCLTLSLTDLLQDFRLAEAKLASYVQVLKEKVSKAEGVVIGMKQKEELAKTKATLQKNLEVFEITKKITKMLLQCSDQIRRNAAFLPIQIIAQLGPAYKGYEYLEKLVSDCIQWCNHKHLPLIMPLTECMDKPGGNLLYTIGVEMSGPDNLREVRHRRMFMQEDTDRLYVIQHQEDTSDRIYVFDIVDNGSCITVAETEQHFQSLKFTANKYLLLEGLGKNGTDLTNPSHYLYKTITSPPVVLQKPHSVISVSESGKYLAYASGSQVCICLCKKDVPLLHTIGNHKRPVTSMHISHDDTLLLTTDQNALVQDTLAEDSETTEGQPKAFIFDLNTKEVLHEVDPQLMVTENNVITKTNIIICFGTGDKNMIYCYDMLSGLIIKGMHIPTGLDTKMMQLHASQKYIMCGFNSTETGEKDSEVVTKCSDIDTAKLLRISDGRFYGECPLNETYASMTVFGTTHIYYAVSTWKANAINIYFSGDVQKPFDKGVLIHQLKGHNGPICEVLVPTRMDILLTGSLDNTIKVWDLRLILNSFHAELSTIEKRLASLSRLEPEPHQIISQYAYRDTSKQSLTTRLCLNKYGDSLYVGTDDGRLLRYSTEKGVMKVSRQTDVGAVHILMLSSSGKYVIAIGRRVHLEDLQSEKHTILELPSHVSCAAEANNILVVGSSGPKSTARIWNIETGQILRDITRSNSFKCLAVHNDGSKIVSTYHSWPILLSLHGVAVKEPDFASTGEKMAEPTCCSLNPKSTLAAVGSDDGCARVINMNGEHVYCLKQKSQVAALTFTPDGKSLLTTGYRSIYIWASGDGQLRYKLTRHQDLITYIQFDPTGQFFLSYSKDKDLVLWDFHRAISIATFNTKCKILGLAMNEGARRIAYIPEGVMDVAILKPNASLRSILDGNPKPVPLESKAQGIALAFSSQNTILSSTCTVM